MKQPLTIVALIYASGVLAGQFLRLPLPWLFGGSAGLVMLALAIPSRRELWLGLLLLLTGWTNLAWRTAIISPHDLRRLIGERAELVTLYGTLAETPSQRVFVREEKETWHTLAPVEVQAICLGSNRQAAVGRVLASTPGLLATNLYAGQAVAVTGVLRPPREPVAEGLFDYRKYLAWQGIFYQLQTEGGADWSLLGPQTSPATPPLADGFQNWAKRILARGLPVEDEELRLLWAMTLGWKTALTGEVSQPFMQSGTMHIFAISGLHIALIAGILMQVLRLVQVPRGVCGLVVIPLIWFYTMATGWQSSAIRSTIMMTVVIAGWALARPGNLLNSLAASGLIILLWDPRQLFQASFQLSFFVVLSIALWMPPFQRWFQRALQPDPFLPDELRPRWKRWRDTVMRGLAASLATSLAAWLGSLPLIACYFHLVTPVSLLANLVIVPLSSLALMCNLGSLLCGDWLPGLTELFNHSAWLWMHWMVRLCDWFVTLPGAYFYVPAPPVWGFPAYYLLLAGALTGWLLAPGRRRWAALAMLVLCVAGLTHWLSERRVVRLAVLPLSGGHAVFVDQPARRNDLLVDCGDERAVEFVVKPFLRAQGVNRLANLVLTHGDIRHVGGAEVVRREFPVAQAQVSSARFRSETYRRVVAGLDRAPGILRRVGSGDELAGWRVLHPQAEDRFAQADDSSVVLSGTIHGIRLLLLGDLGQPAQRCLLDRYPDVQADIVVSGLPQQGEPLVEALLERLQPSLIILGTSGYPATARGTTQLRERLVRHRIPLVCTSEAGSVSLCLSPGGWEARTVRGTIVKSSLKGRPPTVRGVGDWPTPRGDHPEG